MFTLGTPDLGPLPFWTAVNEDWGKDYQLTHYMSKESVIPDPEIKYMLNIFDGERKADRSKSEFKINLRKL